MVELGILRWVGEPGLPRQVPCSYRGPYERKGQSRDSQIRYEDRSRGGSDAVARFEDRGRGIRQGTQVACRSWKRHWTDSPRDSRSNAALLILDFRPVRPRLYL